MKLTVRLPDGMEMIPSCFAEPRTECHAWVMVQKGTYGAPDWQRMYLRCQRLDEHDDEGHRAQYTDPAGELIILRWREAPG